jgi:hypothetical protein
MKVMKEGIYIGQNTTILCFVLGDHVYFEIPVYDDNGNPMEGFETGRPLYSTIDRYIFDLLWKGYKLKEYAAIMEGVLVNPLSLTLCWLGTT